MFQCILLTSSFTHEDASGPCNSFNCLGHFRNVDDSGGDDDDDDDDDHA